MNDNAIEKLFEDEDDWDGLHDAIVEALDISPTKEQAIALFKQLPERIQLLGQEWGLSETEFRDGSYLAIVENDLILAV